MGQATADRLDLFAGFFIEGLLSLRASTEGAPRFLPRLYVELRTMTIDHFLSRALFLLVVFIPCFRELAGSLAQFATQMKLLLHNVKQAPPFGMKCLAIALNRTARLVTEWLEWRRPEITPLFATFIKGAPSMERPSRAPSN